MGMLNDRDMAFMEGLVKRCGGNATREALALITKNAGERCFECEGASVGKYIRIDLGYAVELCDKHLDKKALR